MNKLNLGCGLDTIENFINIDTNPQSTKVLKVTDYTQLGMNKETVDYIRCINTLSKIPREKIMASLEHWFSLLCKGGELYIEIPDANLICNAMTYGQLTLTEFNELIYNNNKQTVFTLTELLPLVKTIGYEVDEKGFIGMSCFMRLSK